MPSRTSKFDVEVQSVEQVLSLKSIAYEVPSFQRPYSWRVEEVSELLSDLYEVDWLDASNQNNAYFLGSIVLAQGDEADLVLDGQQRLTTISLILAVLKKQLQQEGYSSVSEIEQCLVAGRLGKTNKPKIKLQDQDYSIYHELINDPLKFESNEFSASLLSKAVAYIWEKVNGYSDSVRNRLKISKSDALIRMAERILYNLEIVRIKAPSESTAFKLFETLNDRGLALNAADLIKNKLFAQCDREDLDEAFESWQEMLEIVGNSEESQILNYLRYYWIAFQGGVSRSNVYDEFRRKIDNITPSKAINFIKHLRDISKVYRHITFPNIKTCPWGSEAAERLLRLKDYRARSFISALLICSEKYDAMSTALLIKGFESVVVRYSVVGELNPNQLEKVYVSICKRLRSGTEPVDTILRDEFNSYVPRDDEFHEKLSRLQVNTRSSVWRTILIKINESLSTGETRVEGPDRVHIEHLLPQNPSKEALIEACLTVEDANDLKDRIGNLTLLSGRKNQSISNGPFSKKLPVLASSEIALNQAIAESCSEGEPWGRDKIEARCKELADIAVRTWPWPMS